MASQYPELQDRLSKLQDRVENLNPTPVECDVLLKDLDEVGDLAGQEVEFIFGLMERTGELLGHGLMVLRLVMLIVVPLVIVIALGVALGLIAVTAISEAWPFALFALLATSLAGLILLADKKLRARAPEKTETVDEDQAIQKYANMLDVSFAIIEKYANKFDDSTQRKQMCDKPWKGAAALLVLELAVCIAFGRAGLFFQAFVFVMIGVFATGIATCAIDAGDDGLPLGLQGVLHSGPANANMLERAMSVVGRSPFFASASTSVAMLLGFPIVNARFLSPPALATLVETKLRRARDITDRVKKTKKRIVEKLRLTTTPAASAQNFVSDITSRVREASPEVHESVQTGIQVGIQGLAGMAGLLGDAMQRTRPPR